MTKLAIRGGAVRLTLPARLAYDEDALHRSLEQLAERLGHSNCATGCDTLLIRQEREFVVNPDTVALNPQPLPPEALPQDPIPVKSIEVHLHKKLAGDIDGLKRAVTATLERLGCAPCCSGFDIAFRRELDTLAVDADLNVRGTGRFA